MMLDFVHTRIMKDADVNIRSAMKSENIQKFK